MEADVATSWHEVLRSELSQFEIEIHSGVYPLLDLQQVATNARHFEGDPHDSIALNILAESPQSVSRTSAAGGSGGSRYPRSWQGAMQVVQWLGCPDT